MNSTLEPFETVGADHPFSRWAIATLRAECADAASVPRSHLLKRAVEYIDRSAAAHHAAPEHQVGNVFELTDKLFVPYDLGDGQIHLAGCVLEDRPLLRLTRLTGSEASSESVQLEHHYLHPDGQPVEGRLVGQLMLHDIMPYTGKSPRLDPVELEAWVDLARRQLKWGVDRHPPVVTVIWCKYAAGKIRFQYGDQTAHVGFSDWAQLFATGESVPPPFYCEYTDEDSYRVRPTDDGVITVESSLAVCQSSGATVLVNELQSCEVTGLRVLPKFLQTCPVSAQQILPSHAVVCRMCSQHVSPNAMKGHRCSACRRLQPIGNDDRRLVAVLEAYPCLGEWARWGLSELSEVYLLVGSRRLKRILLLIEKDGLAPRHIAQGGRIFGKWSGVDPGNFDHFLC